MIRKLPPEVIRVIAAGQIASSPSAVLKELVENSLDAKATKIKINIEDPLNFSVSDNGTGIPYRELPLTVERFTTSKISSAGDLKSLKTYGFRGEALHAISSVSHLTIKTRHKEEKVGGMLKVKGGKLIDYSPFPFTVGTKVEVKELFFNTPVRRKSIKKREKSNMKETAKLLALANHNVNFQINEEILFAASLEERIRQVFPKVNFSFIEGKDFRLFFTKKWEEKKTISAVFINKRPVKVAEVEKIFEENNIGNYLLFLDISPEIVDVNITPLKDKVYLKDNSVLKEIEKHLKPSVTLPTYFFVRERGEKEYTGRIRLLGSDGTVVVGYDEKYYYFFDQHLLHERVNYEELLEKLKRGEFPLKKIIPSKEFPFEEKLEKGLKKLGIKFQTIGKKIVVTALPQLLNLKDLEKLKEGKSPDSVAETACKRAIKSGCIPTDSTQVEELFEKYLKCKEKEVCPHGRPIYYKVKRSEILRKLGRN